MKVGVREAAFCLRFASGVVGEGGANKEKSDPERA